MKKHRYKSRNLRTKPSRYWTPRRRYRGLIRKESDPSHIGNLGIGQYYEVLELMLNTKPINVTNLMRWSLSLIKTHLQKIGIPDNYTLDEDVTDDE